MLTESLAIALMGVSYIAVVLQARSSSQRAVIASQNQLISVQSQRISGEQRRAQAYARLYEHDATEISRLKYNLAECHASYAGILHERNELARRIRESGGSV